MKRSLRIAVADDEALMQRFYEKMLPHLGHQVVGVATNGRELVEQCRVARPDLVITDFRMPEMDGLAAIEQITSELPVQVIIVSAYPESELADRDGYGDFLACLVKPIKLSDLESAITEALARSAESATTPTESATELP